MRDERERGMRDEREGWESESPSGAYLSTTYIKTYICPYLKHKLGRQRLCRDNPAALWYLWLKPLKASLNQNSDVCGRNLCTSFISFWIILVCYVSFFKSTVWPYGFASTITLKCPQSCCWWDSEMLKDKEVNERVEPVLCYSLTHLHLNTASEQGWETPTGSGTRM